MSYIYLCTYNFCILLLLLLLVCFICIFVILIARIKQVKDAQEQYKSDLHEMQKPLARYADDSDLENLLKSKIRDGDPMLEYITNNRGTGDDSPDGVRHGKS